MGKGFYKKIEDKWVYGQQIALPNETFLDEKNTKNEDGWEWYETPPNEYLEWLVSQNTTHSSDVSKTIENLECGYYKKYYQKWIFIYSKEDNDSDLNNDGYKWYEIAPEDYKMWLNIEKN